MNHALETHLDAQTMERRSCIVEPKPPMIYFWPDGTWCRADELDSMLSWKSDDFGTFEEGELTEEEIDVRVDEMVS